jgi:hypothetical protein
MSIASLSTPSDKGDVLWRLDPSFFWRRFRDLFGVSSGFRELFARNSKMMESVLT